MLEPLKQLRQHLLTGVSYAIPFVACGGILIAIALGFAPKNASGAPDPSSVPSLMFILKVGEAAFGLLMPILAAYIAFSIAGRPGLVAGAIGGFLADHVAQTAEVVKMTTVEGVVVNVTQMKNVSCGFLGAIVAGLLAGLIVLIIKKLPVPQFIKPIMPILIIPVVSSLLIGALMLLLIGPPMADLLKSMTDALRDMQAGNKVMLGALLGAMIAFDMGGPVNKAAFFFASGMIATDSGAMMGPVAAAICTPPLGMGLATVLSRRYWTIEQRESGAAALGMGMIGITEGAIPFAAADPFRVIPCIMAGSMVASVTAILLHVTDRAPHGGPIVLAVIGESGDMTSWAGKAYYVLAITAGALVTAGSILLLKRLGGPPDAAVVDAPNEPAVPSLSAAKDSR